MGKPRAMVADPQLDPGTPHTFFLASPPARHSNITIRDNSADKSGAAIHTAAGTVTFGR